MYCCVTASLLAGAIGDRGRTIPLLVFLFAWATVVYDPIVCWTWNSNGWAAKLGYLDYAGGTPVHISAGYAALAYSWVMGKRSGLGVLEKRDRAAKPYMYDNTNPNNYHNGTNTQSDGNSHTIGVASGLAHFARRLRNRNPNLDKSVDIEQDTIGFETRAISSLNASSHSSLLVVLGTGLIWIGWTGFNAGASIIPTLRTMVAILNTHVSAACGGFTWLVLDYRIRKSWSVVGLCSGIVAGLACITPAAGFVPAWSAPIFGILGALGANCGTKIKYLLHIDDSLDVFAVHGVGGVVGNILTAFFASKHVAGLDGVMEIDGGWINHHYIQLWYQIAGTLAASAYSFGVSAFLLFIIDMIPGLQLRISPADEVDAGLDSVEHDEFAYDYVELIRQLPDSFEELIPSQRPASLSSTARLDYEFNNAPNPQIISQNNGPVYIGTSPPRPERPPANGSEKYSQKFNPPVFRRNSHFSLATNQLAPGLLDETDTVHIQDSEIDPNDPLYAASGSSNSHQQSGLREIELGSEFHQGPRLEERWGESGNGFELGLGNQEREGENTAIQQASTFMHQPTTFRARRNMIHSNTTNNPVFKNIINNTDSNTNIDPITTNNTTGNVENNNNNNNANSTVDNFDSSNITPVNTDLFPSKKEEQNSHQTAVPRNRLRFRSYHTDPSPALETSDIPEQTNTTVPNNQSRKESRSSTDSQSTLGTDRSHPIPHVSLFDQESI